MIVSVSVTQHTGGRDPSDDVLLTVRLDVRQDKATEQWMATPVGGGPAVSHDTLHLAVFECAAMVVGGLPRAIQ